MTDDFTEHLCVMRRTEAHVSGRWEFLSDVVEKTYDVLSTEATTAQQVSSENAVEAS